MNPPPPAALSPPPPRVVSVKDIEATIRRLRGVVAARVVCDAQGGIDEIHTLSDSARPAKMLVRDIESALLAQWNLSPSRNKISVAQLLPNQSPALRPAPPRLQFVSAEQNQHNGTARVVLRQGSGTTEFAGEAEPNNDDQRQAAQAALVATAALRAVERACGLENRPLRLVDVAEVRLGERATITLLVALRTGKGDDLLTGSALLRGSAERAVVAATLDAVNRRLSSLDAAAGPGAGAAAP